jgi:5-oxoprolinase (ATP-hydrolysing) subunit A
MHTIDLNCDLGEDPESIRRGVDAALMRIVTSANIACGGHAGDTSSMELIVAQAAQAGCAIGAHPGYPDRANFGRIAMTLSAAQIESEVASQVGALHAIAAGHGTAVVHLKPHGALYHAAMHNEETARAIARAAGSVAPMALLGQSGASALGLWRAMGFPVVNEAFADRRYEPNGSLRARAKPGALIEDPAEAAEQALRLAQRDPIDAGGTPLRIPADTICIHSDTPGAVEVATAVRAALEAHGITVRAPAPPR